MEGDTAGISTTEAREEAKHPIMYRTAPHNKSFSGPTFQYYSGWKLSFKEIGSQMAAISQLHFGI